MNTIELAATKASPVIRTDDRAIVLDLSTGSRLRGEAIAGLGAEALGRLIDETMAAAGTGFAFGRYAEPRELYDNALFESGGAERRTIHLGIDLFCAAGTPVFAPLDGSVEILANNTGELDYGPLVVLRHEGGADGHFYTLYGHLGPDVLGSLAEGQAVEAGQPFAAVGSPPQNGNWPPHLHLQAILDLKGMGADFPGVALRSEQDHWQTLSPSPAPFFPECSAGELEYS
jgi:murein DD-endopeptidase MepM/ murein hydrolase activator NlpD